MFSSHPSSHINITINQSTRPLDLPKWKIRASVQIGEYCVLDMEYPNCSNFEGRKILVFKDKETSLSKQKHIDPHFYEKSNLVARFHPSGKGWVDAVAFVRSKA